MTITFDEALPGNIGHVVEIPNFRFCTSFKFKFAFTGAVLSTDLAQAMVDRLRACTRFIEETLWRTNGTCFYRSLFIKLYDAVEIPSKLYFQRIVFRRLP